MTLARNYIESRQWAILHDYLNLMLAVSERDVGTQETVGEYIQKVYGEPLPGTRETTVRGDVAIVPIVGPMFRYANLLTEISGATSYERLAADIGRVMDDPEIKTVIYDINSPGGEVDGAGELASLIAGYRGRKKKQIGYISHLGASAAYWIASAMDEVLVAETAMVGSIGAVLSVTEGRGGRQTIEFVSSFSPDKRLDPFAEDATEAKRARTKLQALVDRLGAVFVEAVASNRGMEAEDVTATRGGLFVGTDAISAGLADGVSTLEAIIAAQSDARDSASVSPVSLAASSGGLDQLREDVTMDGQENAVTTPTIDLDFLAANHSDLLTQIQADAAEAERSRILAIHDLDAHGFDAVKRESMEDPNGSAGACAQAILAAQGEQEKRRAKAVQDAMEADEGELENLAASTLPVEEEVNEDQIAASVLSFTRGATVEAVN